MNRHAITLILCLFIGSIHAGVLDHLKPAKNKSSSPGDHSMRNIDFIYMINLDRRPEKYARSMEQLAPYGINPYRFSAIDGLKLSRNTINDVGVRYQKGMDGGYLASYYPRNPTKLRCDEVLGVLGRTYFSYNMGRGIIGCILSHLSVLKDAYDSGYETIWVMEDDIDIIQNPHLISDLVDRLDETVGKTEWDILFTDRDTKDRKGQYVPAWGMANRPNYNPEDRIRFYTKEPVGEDFIRIGARFGAYSMIFRRGGIEKLLHFYQHYQAYLPYDMDYYLPEDIRLFTVQEDVVSHLTDAISDNNPDDGKFL